MEKVPNLNMFTQRQLKKSNSLSRINNDSSSYRPSSTFQQTNSKSKEEDYYGQALKLLNSDSKITNQLRNIQIKHDEDNWKKSNLKKMARHKPFQTQLKTSSNVQNVPHIIIPNPSPQIHAIASHGPQIYFNNSPPNMMRTSQTFKPSPTFIPNNTFQAGQPVQIQQVPFHIIPQNHQMQQNNVRIIQQIPTSPQQFPCQPQPQIQRRNSAQNLHFGNYSYPDKIMSQCHISPICNNQQEKATQSGADKKQYTFRNKKEPDSPVKTYNPFLFDATYLLEIKESESRLPDITALISNKEYSEQLDKKQELLQQLYEIRKQNVVQSKQFLHQLDCLISQFQSKQTESKPMQESVMRNSRRSLFSKLQ